MPKIIKGIARNAVHETMAAPQPESGEVAQTVTQCDPAALPQLQPPTAAESQPSQEQTVLVEVPIDPIAEVTFALHVDLRLSIDQSNAVRRVAAALDRQHARLASGKPVYGANDTIRYLLEQIAAQNPA